MAPQDTNIDDYYSHIPSQDNGDEWEKKSVFKLKIKAKKPDQDEIEPVVSEPKIMLPQEEKPKIVIKKQPAVITFEERKVIKKEDPVPLPKRDFKPHNQDRSQFNRPQNNFQRPQNNFRRDENRPAQTSETVQTPTPRNFTPTPREDKLTLNNFPKREPAIRFEPRKEVETRSETPVTPRVSPVSIDSESLERFSANKKKNFWENKQPDSARKSPFSYNDDSKRFKWKKWFKFKAFEEDDGTFRRSKKSAWEKTEKNVDDIKQTLVDKSWQEVHLSDFLTVKEFSEKLWVPMSKIIWEFLKNGMMVNLNTRVDFDTCFIIAETFSIKVIKEVNWNVSIASVLEWNLEDLMKNDDPTKRIDRAPIISIMWHVDHWKTSILDYIRKTEVASWEAWGITQKIWAYQVEKHGKKITFLDTPWHEAFSIMRARWAKLTDIAIIVVAADEWMKPQTIESINHAKQAWVQIIVAVNKMDKPGANLDFVKWQLAEQWLHPEDWGGTTVVVPVSAHTWLWIETLLEMILLVSEMQELKADPTRSAIATVIESHLDSKLWSLATILVNSGTLNKSDYVVCWSAYWRLRFIKDYKWKNIDSAGPSMPVLISWLSSVVDWWDILQVTTDIETAKVKAHEFELVKASKSINQFEWASLELLLSRIKTWNLKQLKVVVKTDSNWSLEALKEALHKLWTNEIKVQIIHSWVWDINESDVIMAGTSQAILVWYNVWVWANAKHTLQNSKIEFINKKVIYHILEKLEWIITWMIDIKHDDVDLWEAKVKAIFFTSKDRMVIGCELKEWKVESKAKVRVVRNSKKAWSWDLVWLKHWVVDVNEILEWEFWIAFKWDTIIEVWDILEFYKIVQRK